MPTVIETGPVQPRQNAPRSPGEKKLYMVNEGSHCELVNTGKVDGSGNPIHVMHQFTPGEAFESDQDLCAPQYNPPGSWPKFSDLSKKATAPGFFWDSAKETIDQFAARMKLQSAGPGGAVILQPPPPQPGAEQGARAPDGSYLPPIVRSEAHKDELLQHGRVINPETAIPNLDKLSINDLRRYAQDEGIKLDETHKSRADVMKVIKDAKGIAS